MLANIIFILCVLALLPLILFRRKKKIARAGEEGFANVQIIFDKNKNAFGVATVTTGAVFLFLLFSVGILYWSNGSPQITMSGVLTAITDVMLASIVCFLLAFLYHLLFLRESVSYNYSGLGPGLENAYQKNFLIVSAEGIKGAVSVRWSEFNSVVRANDQTVTIKTLRRPLWLYNLFGMNMVTLKFATAEDSVRFESELKRYKPY